MTDKPEISIILPVYNQADHVEKVMRTYINVMNSLRHPVEYLLVVNGNRDGSLECCQRLAEQNSSVRVLHNELPGWGRAVKTGLANARGATLCYTNLARTAGEVLASHIMTALSNPNSVIKSNRRLRHPVVRRVGSVIYNVECRYLFDLPSWDINGTPKIFSRKAFGLLDLQENGDLIDVEFIVRCKQLGLQILELPTVSSVRYGGDTTTNYASAVKMYLGAVRMWWNFRKTQGLGNGLDD
jgi:glycosyltransferase involved in cell wall biosynthesis